LAVPRIDADGYVPVPGGMRIHRDCIVHVHDGYHVDTNAVGQRVLVHTLSGVESRVLADCPHPAKPADPNLQIYAMDTHWTAPTGLVTQMNASFNAPQKPPSDQGQVVYFWPGFKSTQPTMGYPVLQPVLQYGTDSEGGGDYWCVRSWFVCGQWGMALVSDEVAVSPGDVLTSYMSYDAPSTMWTVFAANTATTKTTALTVTRTKIRSTDFHVAMLVLETIMDQGDCSQYPAAGSVTFTGVSVNGQVPTWEPRVSMHDCNQAVSVAGGGATVKMSWSG